MEEDSGDEDEEDMDEEFDEDGENDEDAPSLLDHVEDEEMGSVESGFEVESSEGAEEDEDAEWSGFGGPDVDPEVSDTTQSLASQSQVPAEKPVPGMSPFSLSWS